ncbi:hypothetical protein VARIO8X_100163 [Burkholderiales bacterium 8X]|nr:hypothetical protein VARIO8X_100163 [Burkholderiales bacterium 8X]
MIAGVCIVMSRTVGTSALGVSLLLVDGAEEVSADGVSAGLFVVQPARPRAKAAIIRRRWGVFMWVGITPGSAAHGSGLQGVDRSPLY